MKFNKILAVVIMLALCCGCVGRTDMKKNELESISYKAYEKDLNLSDSKHRNTINKEYVMKDIKEIMDRGLLRVGMVVGDIEVFSNQTNGKLEGIDVDLSKGIADSLGVELAINQTAKTYDDLATLLINGDIDLIISMYSMTANRATMLNFSEPYFTQNMSLIANKVWLAKNKIESNPLEYIVENSVKFGVFKGSAEADVVAELFPNAEVLEFSTNEELYGSIMHGDVQCGIAEETVCLANFIKDPKLMIYEKAFIFSDKADQYCIGVAPNKPGLLNFVNDYIKTQKQLEIEDIEKRCKKIYNY